MEDVEHEQAHEELLAQVSGHHRERQDRISTEAHHRRVYRAATEARHAHLEAQSETDCRRLPLLRPERPHALLPHACRNVAAAVSVEIEF